MTSFLILFSLVCILILSSLIVAYTYANKIYLNLESKKESASSFTLKILTDNPRLYISALKLGNGIFLVIFCFAFYQLYESWSSTLLYTYGYSVYIAVFIAIAVFLIYLLSKFIPQTFVKPYATQIITRYDILVSIFLKLLTPLANPLLKLSDLLLEKIWGLTTSNDMQLLSIGDLGSYITKQMESVEEQKDLDTELQILKNALTFTDVKAREIMTPRVEIESVPLNCPMNIVKQRFIETGYSKLLVYENTSDNIIGYIHIFEILQNPETISQILYPIEIIAQTTYIKELLQTLSVKRKSVAIVVDEYGGLAGMVTIEDIIEELFGEIDDEHDDLVEWIEKRIGTKRFIFSARLEVAYINEKYQLHLTEHADYNTLGGYIINHSNTIPLKGDQITIEAKQFKILASSDKKIEIVEVILP